MGLSSSSTLTDALAQYNNNLAWWESTTKAAALLEAVLYLLAQKPETIISATTNATYASLESLKSKLEPHVLGSDLAAGLSRASFVNGRPRCL